MEDFASELRTLGLIMGPLGLVNLGVGMLMARHPKFPSWIGATLQYASIAFMLAGAILYFQPWGDQIALHAVGLIFMIALALMVTRFRHVWNADRGNSPQ